MADPSMVRPLAVEVPPLEIGPLIVVAPVPVMVRVLLVAVFERFTGPDSFRLLVEMLLVMMRDPVAVTVPVNSRLLVPWKMLLLVRLTVALVIALAPLKSMLAENDAPFIETVEVPKAALLPRTKLPRRFVKPV